MSDLAAKKCVPCEGGAEPLAAEDAAKLIAKLDGWRLSDDAKEIARRFDFANYYPVMAFVNAIAWMAHQEGHHPDMEVSYNRLVVRYSTHAIGGLSENDFICAAKVDALYSS